MLAGLCGLVSGNAEKGKGKGQGGGKFGARQASNQRQASHEAWTLPFATADAAIMGNEEWKPWRTVSVAIAQNRLGCVPQWGWVTKWSTLFDEKPSKGKGDNKCAVTTLVNRRKKRRQQFVERVDDAAEELSQKQGQRLRSKLKADDHGREVSITQPLVCCFLKSILSEVEGWG